MQSRLSTIIDEYPIRDLLRKYLSPYDFASVLNAYSKRPTEHEKMTYLDTINFLLNPEVLHDLKSHNIKVYMVGDDTSKLVSYMNCDENAEQSYKDMYHVSMYFFSDQSIADDEDHECSLPSFFERDNSHLVLDGIKNVLVDTYECVIHDINIYVHNVGRMVTSSDDDDSDMDQHGDDYFERKMFLYRPTYINGMICVEMNDLSMISNHITDDTGHEHECVPYITDGNRRLRYAKYSKDHVRILKDTPLVHDHFRINTYMAYLWRSENLQTMTSCGYILDYI